MKPKILMVDDEKQILQAYVRNLRGDFDVTMANSGAEALEALGIVAYPVIVTDYRMPVMNGVDLLKKVHDISPDTVQIMLTGQADIEAIVNLINKTKIFKFLTKPCESEDLIMIINDAIRQNKLITAERELLGKTLGGSIHVLTDLLAMAKPQAFQRAQRIRGMVRLILKEINTPDAWQIEIAAMLSQIGCVTIPDDILKSAYGTRKLTDYKLAMFQNHPILAADMIKNIPRLEAVAEIIRYQEKNFNGEGIPDNNVCRESIPLGSRILKIAIDYDKIMNDGAEPEKAFEELKTKKGLYDEALLEKAKPAFDVIMKKSWRFSTKDISFDQIKQGMYLAEDAVTASGIIIGSKNQKITLPLISTLKNYEKNKQIKGIIKLFVPVE